jgi:hypothetical protein
MSGLTVMCVSVMLTALSSTGNAYIIKTISAETPLPLQNMVLYGTGAVMNYQVFLLSYSGFLYGSNDAGFFDGYDNPYAVGVVFCSGLIGVAITFVYKYGDAVIKCFATVLSSMLLIVFSTIFFDLVVTLTSVCGCIVVFTASYLYMIVSPEVKKLESQVEKGESNKQKYEGKGNRSGDHVNDEDTSIPLLPMNKKTSPKVSSEVRSGFSSSV